jgi:protein TonB
MMTPSLFFALRPQTSAQALYGASELKSYIRTSTLRGFVGSLSVLALIFLGYGALALANRINTRSAPVIAKMNIMTLPPTPPSQAIPPPQLTLPNAPLARAGTPVAVPDEALQPDVQDFANVDEISRATLNGGNGIDEGFMPLVTEITTEVREEELEPYVFIPVEKEPYIDIKELQKSVIYPDLAKRVGVEGKVNIRVLVGKNGVPKKWIIESSDSDLLNESAIKAVMKSVFTPAIQNNQPIDCWVSVPIIYRLR